MTSELFWIAAGLAVLSALAGRAVLQRARKRRARTWPAVPGTVTSAVIRLETRGDGSVLAAEVGYRYAVEDGSYSGRLRRTFMLSGRAEAWIGRFPEGAPLAVRYDPQRPADSLVFEDEQSSDPPR